LPDNGNFAKVGGPQKMKKGKNWNCLLIFFDW
jgi:hypothetical protein